MSDCLVCGERLANRVLSRAHEAPEAAWFQELAGPALPTEAGWAHGAGLGSRPDSPLTAGWSWHLYALRVPGANSHVVGSLQSRHPGTVSRSKG